MEPVFKPLDRLRSGFAEDFSIEGLETTGYLPERQGTHGLTTSPQAAKRSIYLDELGGYTLGFWRHHKAPRNLLESFGDISDVHRNHRSIAGQRLLYYIRRAFMITGQQNHIAGIDPDWNVTVFHALQCVKLEAAPQRFSRLHGRPGEPNPFTRGA